MQHGLEHCLHEALTSMLRRGAGDSSDSRHVRAASALQWT